MLIELARLDPTPRAPVSFEVHVVGDEATDALACGRVDPGQYARFGEDGEPAPGGLFDEQVFGPLLRDEAGKPRLEPTRGVPACRKPQGTRFGALELPFAVPHPWTRAAILRRIPVLPAGLRPVIRVGGREVVHDLTQLYGFVAARIRRYRRLLQLAAPPAIIAAEVEMIARSVDALFLHGGVLEEDEDGTFVVPAVPGQPAVYRSLLHHLHRRPGWSAEVDALLGAGTSVESADWPDPQSWFRAWLQASALQIVPVAGRTST
jgi:hypothetical protein